MDVKILLIVHYAFFLQDARKMNTYRISRTPVCTYFISRIHGRFLMKFIARLFYEKFVSLLILI